MPNYRRQGALCLGLCALLASGAAPARAQVQPTGFAVERFYPSAPGGGYFVMDSLDMHGGLGGVLALSFGYAKNPLRIPDGAGSLAVVSDQAFAGIAAALTYSGLRVYLNLEMPLVISGQSGTVGDDAFTAPNVNLAATPDTLSDARLGLDARLIGGPHSPFRLGAGAQLYIPFAGNRANYTTDGTFRGMARILFAGDLGPFSYAGQLGVHLRPLDDHDIPGSPQGNELLLGIAGGAKLPRLGHGSLLMIIGPEVYGATAFFNLFGKSATALEGLLTARIEGTRDDRLQLRIKLGAGAGLIPGFGAPEWRLLFGIEMFNHNERHN